MPRIPTTESNSSILGGGSFSASAPVGAFGLDLSGVARASAAVSTAIVLNRKNALAVEERDRQKEEAQWLNKSLSEYSRSLTDFEVNPENRARVDYLPSFLEHGDRTAQGYLESAPSSEAYEEFRERSRAVIDQRYERSASLSAENEMKADLVVIDDAWGHTMQAFHSFSPIDPDSASRDLLTGLEITSDHIISVYSDIAPELSRKMVAQKVEDVVLALSDKNPELAKELVNSNSYYIDENKRKILLNKIEEKVVNGSLLLKEDFNNVREKTLIEAQRDGVYAPLPLEDYQAVYDGEQAIVMKQRDDRKAGAAITAHDFLSEIKDAVPSEKIRLFEEKQKTLDSDDLLAAFGAIVAPALREDMDLYERDPVAWQLKNNPVVKLNQHDMAELGNNAVPYEQGVAAHDGPGLLPPRTDASPESSVKRNVAGVEVVPTPDQELASREQYYNSLLRYQGSPQEGEDPKRFMNRPRNQWRIMTQSEAESLANHINGSDIDSVIGIMNGFLDKYPTDELKAQAISDLTTLPQNKIKPEFAIAFQNRNEPWLPEFIGNLRSIKDLESMTKVDQAKVRTTISSNKLWNSFRSTMMGPQNQRSAELEGYFNAIEIDAKAMALKGKPIDKAVEHSIDRILGSTMLPAKLSTPGFNTGTLNVDWDMWGNERPQIWIPRKPAGFTRTLNEQDVENYAQRMGVAIAEIHPDDVDINQFIGYKLDDIDKQRDLIYNQIVKTGSYYPEPGGAYWRLTVESASGQRVDLRDKDGNFFRLPLKAVPSYTVKVKELEMKGLSPSTWGLKDVPKFHDYPQGDYAPSQKSGWKKVYPKTGSFWQRVK